MQHLDTNPLIMNNAHYREPIMLEDMQEILCVWRVISSILP